MTKRKLTELVELSTADDADLIHILDVSEPVVTNQNKKITVQNLLDGLGAGGDATAVVIGNGVDSVFTANHPYGQRSVFVTVHRNAAPYDIVHPELELTTSSSVTIDFNAEVPSTNEYVVLISPGSGGTGGGGTSSPLSVKGDIWGYDTSDARIPVGTDGQVLSANSATALGVEWTTVSGGEPYVEITSSSTLPVGGGTNTIAIGPSTVVTGIDSIVIGNGPSTGQQSSIALGTNASVAGNNAIAIGTSAEAGDVTAGSLPDGNESIAIGFEAKAFQSNAVQIGPGTNSNAATIQFFDSTIAGAQGIVAEVLPSVPTAFALDGTLKIDGSTQELYLRDNSAWHKVGGLSPYFVETFTGAVPTTDNPEQLAIGQGASTSISSNAIAIGLNASCAGAGVAIGGGSNATSLGIAIGNGEAGGGVNIGYSNALCVIDDIRVGNNNTSLSGTRNILIGADNITEGGVRPLILGYDNQVSGDDCISIGTDIVHNSAPAARKVSIGHGCTVGAADVIAIGSDCTAEGVNSLAIGKNANTRAATNAIAIGNSAIFSVTGMDNSILIGNGANGASTATDATFIGPSSSGTGARGVAIGNAAAANSTSGIAIGDAATAGGILETIAIGANSSSQADGGIAIGDTAVVTAANALQLGTGTNSTANTLQYLTNTIATSDGVKVPYQTTGVAPTSTPADGTLVLDNNGGTTTLWARANGAWVSLVSV